jgi:hypothetical protein
MESLEKLIQIHVHDVVQDPRAFVASVENQASCADRSRTATTRVLPHPNWQPRSNLLGGHKPALNGCKAFVAGS